MDDERVVPGRNGRWRDLEDLVERLRGDRLSAGLVAAAAAGVVALAVLAYRTVVPPSGPLPEELLPRVELAPTSAPPTTAASVVVHVVGAVAEPGVRELPPGARVLDALQASGGPTATADLGQLNLAAPVGDGSQIRVPHQGEVLAGPLVVAPGPSEGEEPGFPVVLNSATAAQLEALPGVGPSTAAAIIAWRDAHGPFSSVDQLLEVRGIGPAKFEAIRNLVVP